MAGSPTVCAPDAGVWVADAAVQLFVESPQWAARAAAAEAVAATVFSPSTAVVIQPDDSVLDYSGKVGSHAPLLTFDADANTATIAVAHGMSAAIACCEKTVYFACLCDSTTELGVSYRRGISLLFDNIIP